MPALFIWLAAVVGYAIAASLGFTYSPRRTTLVLTRIATTGVRAATAGVTTTARTVTLFMYGAIVSFLFIICGGVGLLLAAWSGSLTFFWIMFGVATLSIFVTMLGWFAANNTSVGLAESLEDFGNMLTGSPLAIMLLIPAVVGSAARIAGFAARQAASVSGWFFQLMAGVNVSFYGFAGVALIDAHFNEGNLISDPGFLGLCLALGILTTTASLAKIKTFSIVTLPRVAMFATIVLILGISTKAFPALAANADRMLVNGYAHLVNQADRVAGNSNPNEASYVKTRGIIQHQFLQVSGKLIAVQKPAIPSQKTGVLVYKNENGRKFGKSPKKWVCVLWIDDPNDPLMDLAETSPRATWVDNDLLDHVGNTAPSASYGGGQSSQQQATTQQTTTQQVAAVKPQTAAVVPGNCPKPPQCSEAIKVDVSGKFSFTANCYYGAKLIVLQPNEALDVTYTNGNINPGSPSADPGYQPPAPMGFTLVNPTGWECRAFSNLPTLHGVVLTTTDGQEHAFTGNSLHVANTSSTAITVTMRYNDRADFFVHHTGAMNFKLTKTP